MDEDMLENWWDVVFSRTECSKWMKNHDLIVPYVQDFLMEFGYPFAEG